MYISGTGISTYRVRIKPDFKPSTTLALSWVQCADGNFKATDRGTSVDVYETEFNLYAKEEEINQFVNAVYSNRTAGVCHFSLSGFESTEHIFGEDVDHTGSIDVTILDISDIKQGSWKVRGITVKARALSPTFIGSPSLPTLKSLDIGYGEAVNRTIEKYDSYTGAFSYIDRACDTGVFTGTFLFSLADMRAMRRYIATERGDTISIPAIHGVEYPFGPYRNSTYPINVKITDWQDLGMWGVQHWKMQITMIEVV